MSTLRSRYGGESPARYGAVGRFVRTASASVVDRSGAVREPGAQDGSTYRRSIERWGTSAAAERGGDGGSATATGGNAMPTGSQRVRIAEETDAGGPEDGRSHELAEMTWRDVEAALERTPTLLVPVGSTGQHGHHLPLGIDVFMPEDVCQRDATRTDCLLAPSVWYGVSPHHTFRPGTFTVGSETILRVVGQCGSVGGLAFRSRETRCLLATVRLGRCAARTGLAVSLVG